jgi:hypothetical protein
VRSRWTLFGPYASSRWRPLGNGPTRNIINLGRSGTPRNARNQLEVLAGAISWGFKSPSPHQCSPRRELGPRCASDCSGNCSGFESPRLSRQLLPGEERKRRRAFGPCAARVREILPGFESLDLRSAGANLRTLAVRFNDSQTSSPGCGFSLAFGELSDGQRVLICLYALLNFAVGGSGSLFIDEPENYIAIPEIQHWLMEIRDRIEDHGG